MGRQASIRLSEKHGVNPSIGKCVLCYADTGEIILMGKLKDDVEAPRNISHGLCEKCKALLKEGNVGFINTENGDTAIIKKSGIVDVFGEQAADDVSGKVVKVKKSFWLTEDNDGNDR